MLPKPLVDEIDRYLNRNGRRTVKDDRNVGDYTLVSRRSGLLCGFAELRQMGFKLLKAESLRDNHIKALVNYWMQEEFSASTIQNRLAHFRSLSKWIGKPGMVRSTMSYVDEANRHRVRRTVAAQVNLSWKGKGIDATEVIKEAELRDKYTALYLRLMHAFGLRLREAICLRPIVDVGDNGDFLSVRDGTKGGRHRIVRIETDYQRETLSLAAAMSQSKNKRIIPAHRTLEQAYQRTRYQMRKLGLTREGLGVTAHGLRHQYAQSRYEQIAGIPSPICGGNPAQIDRDTHLHACYDVMQQLGHSRVDVAASYYGTHGHKLRGKDNPGMPWEREARKARTIPSSHTYQPTLAAPNYGEGSHRTAKVQYSFVLRDEVSAMEAIANDSSEQEAS
jgi:site-specific recombinase XerD